MVIGNKMAESKEEELDSLQTVETLKREKSNAKAAFTRVKNQLLQLLEDLPSRTELKTQRYKLNDAQERIVNSLEILSKEYSQQNDEENVKKTNDEMEKIITEYETAEHRCQAYLDEINSESSSASSSIKHQEIDEYEEQLREEVKKKEQIIRQKQIELEEEFRRRQKELNEQFEQEREHLLKAEHDAKIKHHEIEKQVGNELERTTDIGLQSLSVQNDRKIVPEYKPESGSSAIGTDLWKQLKRVSIPIFSGNKRNYQSWKAAFIACIDKAPATKEYKLLQLRQYLEGEALQVIENLGHSAVAYEAAKERLDRKYGGHRRQIALYIEELENFKPMRDGESRDIEKFADLLDIAVVNLKEAGRLDELKNGSLYNKLQRKMTESMLSRYHRWIFEKEKIESVECLREWILQESEFQTIASETIHGLSTNTNTQRKVKGNRRDGLRTFFSEPQNVAKTENKDILHQLCKFCNKRHGIWRCDEFRKLTVQKRWDTAKRFQLCYRCLGHDHFGKQCRRSRVCNLSGCKKVHHRLLHRDRNYDRLISDEPRRKVKPEVQFETNSTIDKPEMNHTSTEGERKDRTMVGRDKKANFVTLRTVPVILKNGNRRVKVNALLDDASTKTYINADVAAELGLQGQVQKVTVNVLNDNVESFETMPIEVGLQSLNGQTDTTITAFTTNRVTGNMQPINWKQHARKWEHLAGIQFPNLGQRPTVDVLIGLDYSDLHYSYRDVRGKPGEPIARLTPLGWTCIGNPNDGQEQTLYNRTYFVHDLENHGDIDNIVKKFWEIENVKTQVENLILNNEEKQALAKVEHSLNFHDGHYEVGVPWKDNAPELPDNYRMALRRLENTEKRLIKRPEIADAYTETIEKYIEKGYVSKVTNDTATRKWYLPHFAVVRPEKETTKTRIVFDASAKYDGISLNDVIHQGPKLQRDLFDVLLRFRKNPVALVCDIAEMYLRIRIPMNDRPFHRFLWRSLKTEDKPEQYEFNTVVFGVNSSPFQAQYVSRKHAELYKNDFPMAAETVLKSTYMDDSMDSVLNDEQGIELYNQLSQLWGKAGMHARKWLSNSQVVLQSIPEEDRASEVYLDEGNLPSVKTLGVLWQADNDIFTFKANPPDVNFKFTKRNFLSKIATLFDPLGFIAPFTIRAKVLLQEMWTSGLDWDDSLNDILVNKSREWFRELGELCCLKIPRCLQLDEDIISTTIHTFVDASQEAYGSVVYARHVYKNGLVSARLIAAKSRVAPLTSVSIPRLELMAAVLGLRLALSVRQALEVSEEHLVFWSDSMNVMHWIRSKSRDFKPFVANRIGEIHNSSNPKQWRHVPTNVNPADLLSRGRRVNQLQSDFIWWNGPEFLQKEEDQWPQTNIEIANICDNELRRQKKNNSANQNHTDCTTLKSIHISDPKWRLDPARYSSFVRLVRVLAWVNRFIDNCRLKRQERRGGTLCIAEIEDAEIMIIKNTQKESFKAEYFALINNREIPKTSKLLSLNPRIDEHGLVRCDGRLKYAEFLPFDVRYPIILPRKNWITKLIVKRYHENGKHVSGTNQTLSSLSAKFWIISGREEIREYENECYYCRRKKAKAAEQVMAPLPEIRFKTPLHAFARTAVDFGGPFITVQGRGKRREKRYLCLFTCLNSRAVHLEVAFGLDTDSFLNAFYRMVNRRGLPKEVISDNGTNFVGANKELQELVSLLDKDKINDAICNQGIKWHFNPPLAPHFGGVHETMIKAAKRAIYAILGNADITDEELLTAFTGAEALINSRPLTYQSANPKDDIPLTPNHFLHGQIGGQFAPESVDTMDFNPRKRWRRIQELIKHFWQRWIREWLPGLSKRHKWTKTRKDLKPGDVVLVMNPNLPRGHWPLGRIIEVFPGKDGHVRVAKLLLGQNVLVRPISKLCSLETETCESDQKDVK